MIFDRPVIDSHVHVRWVEDGTESYFDFLDRLQTRHGHKGLNICACPCVVNGKTGESWGVENNIFAALYKLHNPTAYAYGGFFYPTRPVERMPAGLELHTQYEELMALGFDGIKMLETKVKEQKCFGLWVEDGLFADFFARCEADGTHIVWHVADPDTFWDLNRIPARHLAKGWYYGDGTYPSWERIYESVFRVLERHPKLKVTFAHFFFWSPWPEKLAALLDRFENVSVDVTPGAEMYGFFRDNREAYRDFFIRYADRILYGTDVVFPSNAVNSARPEQVYRFLTTDETLTVVDVPTRGLALPEDVCDKILHRNFEDRAGVAPKPVDRELLRHYIQKYLPYITQEKCRSWILSAM